MSGFQLRLTHIVTTCPKPISEWAIAKISRRQVMWNELGHAFLTGLETILAPGLGADTNYHNWSSKNPLEPHSHFHHLVANLQYIDAGRTDEQGEPVYELQEIPWHKQHHGNMHNVPLDDKQLIATKKLWWRLLKAFNTKHHLDWNPGDKEDGWKGIDVFVEPRDNWAAIIGTMNYINRHPIEDYAIYSNNHLDCPFPPSWLEHYSNKSRPFGWWRNLKAMTGTQEPEREKLHPLTGEAMQYQGTYTLKELLERNHGALGFLDVVKGKPVISCLDRWELDWLKSVQKKRPP